MKNVMYKIIMGCYIVAASCLSPPVMTTWIFSRHTRSASKRCQYPKG